MIEKYCGDIEEIFGWELNLIATSWITVYYFFLNYSFLIYKMENKYYEGLW